jgi:hypothetical protein
VEETGGKELQDYTHGALRSSLTAAGVCVCVEGWGGEVSHRS